MGVSPLKCSIGQVRGTKEGFPPIRRGTILEFHDYRVSRKLLSSDKIMPATAPGWRVSCAEAEGRRLGKRVSGVQHPRREGVRSPSSGGGRGLGGGGEVHPVSQETSKEAAGGIAPGQGRRRPSGTGSKDVLPASDVGDEVALAWLTRMSVPRRKLTIPGGVFRRDVTKRLGRKRVRLWGSF